MSRKIQLVVSKPEEKVWAACALLGEHQWYVPIDLIGELLLKAEHTARCDRRSSEDRYALLDNVAGPTRWDDPTIAHALSSCISKGLIRTIRDDGTGINYCMSISEKGMRRHTVHNGEVPRILDTLVQRARLESILHDEARTTADRR